MFRHTDTPPPANRETESANRKIESLKNRQSTTTGQRDSQWKDILLPSQLSSQTFSLTVLTLPVRKTPAYQKGAKDRQMYPKPGGQTEIPHPVGQTHPQPLVEQRFPQLARTYLLHYLPCLPVTTTDMQGSLTLSVASALQVASFQ